MNSVAGKLRRFVPVVVRSPLVSGLSSEDKNCLETVVKAARIMDQVWAVQMWKEGPQFLSEANASLDHSSDLYKLIKINRGPWSELDDFASFIPKDNTTFSMTIPSRAPDTGNFYPGDITKSEFNEWLETLNEEEKKEATGYYSFIRRDNEGKLKMVPFSVEMKILLSEAATLLREASSQSSSSSLSKFLKERADAFETDLYTQSSRSWLLIDSPISVTMGADFIYHDRLFGYKASFDALIGVRDAEETKKLEVFQSKLQELENHLPMQEKFKNPNVSLLTPIEVVDSVFSAGNYGSCHPLAFCLPIDEKFALAHGKKITMMKNVSHLKYTNIMIPIANECIVASQASRSTFEAFWNHVLCHECCHSIGPQTISSGETVRSQLLELHSALEEAKADILGVWALQYLIDTGVLPPSIEQAMYISHVAAAIRGVRFGIQEAHGKGLVLQFNFLFENGGFSFDSDARKFVIHQEKMKSLVVPLAEIILAIQAEGSRDGATKLFEKYCFISPELRECLDRLETIPVDLLPNFEFADHSSSSDLA